jgi:hypothetical protein
MTMTGPRSGLFTTFPEKAASHNGAAWDPKLMGSGAGVGVGVSVGYGVAVGVNVDVAVGIEVDVAVLVGATVCITP